MSDHRRQSCRPLEDGFGFKAAPEETPDKPKKVPRVNESGKEAYVLDAEVVCQL